VPGNGIDGLNFSPEARSAPGIEDPVSRILNELLDLIRGDAFRGILAGLESF
jgi:hypothetical protein